MSTRMPILRKILAADAWNVESDNLTLQLLKDIKKAASFDIQVAADIQQQKALEAKNKRIIIDSSAGQIRSPYPELWMEWSRGDYHAGCLLAQRDKRADNRYFDATYSDQVMLFWFLRNSDYGLGRMDYNVLINLTDDDCFGGWAIDGEPLSDELSNMTQTFIGVVVTALALINCKNVETKNVGSITIRRSGAEKRRGVPKQEVRYHTIILPGGGTQTDGKGQHRATALHRVRGHFKTFTAERPLMGRHVGTYWWGWQVRGNPEKGVVVSDYKLTNAREEHSNA